MEQIYFGLIFSLVWIQSALVIFIFYQKKKQSFKERSGQFDDFSFVPERHNQVKRGHDNPYQFVTICVLPVCHCIQTHN